MCGIVAVLARPGRFSEPDLAKAIGALSHRGPDGQGIARVYRDANWECWFAHARLAIVDLSPGGAQPMVREGRGAVVFNGEVYDHQKLRQKAPSWEFRSRSDTETLLARALDDPEAALVDANAMLAMALVDTQKRRLVIARDRLGKKPLFVYRGPDILALASELKAFAAMGLPLTLDAQALAEYHWLSYVPAPRSIWRECTKFPAASWASVDLAQPELRELSPKTFWDPLGGFGERFSGTYEEALDALDATLADATKIRLEADVPVGLFLSGGIDSSLVAAHVARTNRRDVRAFVVATNDPRFDESERATATAKALELPVHVIRVPRGARPETLERLTWYFDEPHAPPSQLGVMEMSAVAKAHASVVLTGDGGDEAFLGYPWVRYPGFLSIPRRVLRRLPGAASLLALAQREPWLGLVSRGAGLVGLNPTSTGRKLRSVHEALDAVRDADTYDIFQAIRLRSDLSPADRGRVGTRSLLARLEGLYPTYAWQPVLDRGSREVAGAIDLLTYLRDDVLQKVDRGTMAHAIEARSPLLDFRIVEFGQSLPTSFKQRRGVHKRILRDLASRLVDPEIARLPKQGFAVESPLGKNASAEAWCAYVEADWFRHWSSGTYR